MHCNQEHEGETTVALMLLEVQTFEVVVVVVAAGTVVVVVVAGTVVVVVDIAPH